MGSSMEEVEFFFGLGSRYSYLAFTQIARIEATYSCTFNLQPIGSGELLNLRGASPFQGAPLSEQYESDYRRRDASGAAIPCTAQPSAPPAAVLGVRVADRASRAA